jgi:hypothetical protein
MNNFSLDVVAQKYEEYFQMVLDVYTGEGWYQKHDDRTDLNWLTKYYPTK